MQLVRKADSPTGPALRDDAPAQGCAWPIALTFRPSDLHPRGIPITIIPSPHPSPLPRDPRLKTLDLPSDSTSGHGRYWTVAVCLVLLSATFLNYSNRFAFTQNAVTIQEAFETNEQGYGKLAGNFALGFSIGGLTFGILADIISVRRLYPLVVVVWSLAGIYSGMATSLGAMGASRLILGLFEAGHWPCALRTTQRVFTPDQRTWANSILQSGASLGAVFTPLLVVAVAPHWKWTFYIVGGIGLPWALWWLFTVREEDVQRPVIQTDETSQGIGEQRVLQEIPFWQVFLTRRWWILLVVVVLINTLWHYIRVWMPVTLEKDHGYSKEFVAYFTSLYYLSTFFGSLAAGGLTAMLARKGWNVHRSRLVTFLLFGLLSSLSIAAAFLPRGYLLLGSLLLVAFGSLGLFPVYYSLNQEISAKHQGKVGGSLGFSAWLVLYFVHPIVGSLVDRDPTIRPYLFAAVGIGPLIAFAVLALCWGRRPGDTAAHEA